MYLTCGLTKHHQQLYVWDSGSLVSLSSTIKGSFKSSGLLSLYSLGEKMDDRDRGSDAEVLQVEMNADGESSPNLVITRKLDSHKK